MNANSWYISMILSIFLAVLAFVFGTKVFGYETQQQVWEVVIFFGFLSPTFGALGIRAQLNNN